LWIYSDDRTEFLTAYREGKAAEWILKRYPEMSEEELGHRLHRYGLNPCGEILGNWFHCNLSEIHLNRIDPQDFAAQTEAFEAGALSVAVLLKQQFAIAEFARSRELDPIVGVSFTGLFDFFVAAFGVDWLRWWQLGRPLEYFHTSLTVEMTQLLEVFMVNGVTFEISDVTAINRADLYRQIEAIYLKRWREIVFKTVDKYCEKNGLKTPNRCTTVQPAGTKSLLTGASPGWHPPKSQRYIRRITFAKNDPIALACLKYGYSVVPGQSDKDESGTLLDDPFDARCTEWLVEIPVEVPWANLPGADQIQCDRFSAAAQLDFYGQVQQHYTTHNTSGTVEILESEIPTVAKILRNWMVSDQGYVSVTLLARLLAPFPRLPFEVIDRETYQALLNQVYQRRTVSSFAEALNEDTATQVDLAPVGPAGCDSDFCLSSETRTPKPAVSGQPIF
jgi:ribonucleotide reductase class II